MKLIESGSPPGQTNSKDWVFLVKLAVIAALSAVITVIKDHIPILTDMIPDQYDALFTGGLTLVISFVVQFLGDARKKLEGDDGEEPKNPLPPMTMWLLAFMLFTGSAVIAQVGSYRAESTEQSSEFKPYSLIRLECEEEGTSFVWILRRLPDGFRPDSIRVGQGKEIVWTGPPGTYDIDTIFTDKAGVLQQVYSRVTITSPDSPVNPVPGPVPGPTPPGPSPTPPAPTPPGPVNPDVKPLPKPTGDRFGFGGISYDLAMNIDSKSRNALATKIADNYGAVSSAIFAGGIVDVTKAFEELRSRNRSLASDPSAAAWQPWFDKLGFEVQQKWTNKTFTTRSDIAEVFREIQTGILATQGKTPD